jgi:hypothetical protein
MLFEDTLSLKSFIYAKAAKVLIALLKCTGLDLIVYSFIYNFYKGRFIERSLNNVIKF